MINSTIVRITLRGLFGRRRFLLLLPLPLMLVGLALLAEALGATPTDWAQPVLIGLGFAVVLPVLALIVGGSVLGSEIDDGTVVHILTKPLPRREIILSKLVVAIGVTVVAVGPAMLVTGLLAGSAQLALGLLAGTVVGAIAYGALFLMLSLLTRRPVLIGLIYILVWEGLLGNLLTGTRVLSVQQYAISVAEWAGDTSLFDGTVSVPVALVLTVVIAAAATALAVDRLRSLTLTGETS